MSDEARLEDAGPEPDYRFTLANERTFLAWIRTALALNAGGLAVIELLSPLAVPGAREAIGIALVALGTVVALTSFRRWRGNDRAIRAGEPLPRPSMPLFLAAGATLVSVAALTLLLLSVR